MDVWAAIVVFIGSGAFAALISWLTNRKLSKAQVTKTEAETQEIFSKLYSQMIKDISKQRDEWKEQYERSAERFEQEVSRLRDYTEELKNIIAKLKRQVKELTKENEELKKKIEKH